MLITDDIPTKVVEPEERIQVKEEVKEEEFNTFNDLKDESPAGNFFLDELLLGEDIKPQNDAPAATEKKEEGSFSVSITNAN